MTPDEEKRLADIREYPWINQGSTIDFLLGLMDKARERENRLIRCNAFFVSVIKCGEPWTDTCEAMRKEAIDTALDASPAEPPKGGGILGIDELDY